MTTQPQTQQEAPAITFPPIHELKLYYQHICPALVARLDEIDRDTQKKLEDNHQRHHAHLQSARGSQDGDWQAFDQRHKELSRENDSIWDERNALVLAAIREEKAPLLQKWEKALADTGRTIYHDPGFHKGQQGWPHTEMEILRHEDGSTTFCVTSTYHFKPGTSDEEMGHSIMHAGNYAPNCWESVPTTK